MMSSLMPSEKYSCSEISAHIVESEDCDGRLVSDNWSLNVGLGFIYGHDDRVTIFGNDAEYLDRPGDVLDGLLPATRF